MVLHVTWPLCVIEISIKSDSETENALFLVRLAHFSTTQTIDPAFTPILLIHFEEIDKIRNYELEKPNHQINLKSKYLLPDEKWATKI